MAKSPKKKIHPVKPCKAGISPKAKLFNRIKFPSELRLDLVSKDWVIIATGRAKRPSSFKKEKKAVLKGAKKDCPFCKINTQKDPTLIFSKGKRIPFRGWDSFPKDWSLVSYPAFSPYNKLEKRTENSLYQRMNAVGFHEVIVTRDHKKQIAQFSLEEVEEVFEAYQSRYLDLKDKEFVNYISIFHNHGEQAGASIAHPHSQIITTPLVDSDLNTALKNAKSFFNKKKECIYCKMNKWELESRERVVFENKDFLVVCPFASKKAFQVIVSPKKHSPHFEDLKEKKALAEAFREALRRLYKGLGDPAYNFYLHTAPCDNKEHNYYHWHWTIIPATSISAGFEIGTQMEISTIEPEKAAEYLRKQ